MTQPLDGSQIAWGKGALVDLSKATPPPPWIASSTGGNTSPGNFSSNSPTSKPQSQSTFFSSSTILLAGGDISDQGGSNRVSVTITSTEIVHPSSTESFPVSPPPSSTAVRRFKSSVDVLHLVLPLDTTVLQILIGTFLLITFIAFFEFH
jgi:hypothetical protein